jgi:pSer/pThr/pTyr-binding forkhead associated (FHA) protein
MSGFKVKIFTNEGAQTVSVAKSHLLIGASEYCDIQITGGEVGTEHLRIWSDDGHLWGQDLGSKHGTMLNGQPIQPMRPVLFHEADLFRLGISDATLAFHVTTSGSVRAPVPNLAPSEDTNISNLKEEIEKLKAENLRLQHAFTDLQAEAERKNAVIDPEEEEEISAVKHNALTEIQAMKEAESRRFEVWKQEVVDELEKIVGKTFRKADPKMSREDLGQDVSNALRAHLLGEKIPAPRRRHRTKDGWQRRVLAAIIVCALATAAIFYVKKSNHRTPASVILVPSAYKNLNQ